MASQSTELCPAMHCSIRRTCSKPAAAVQRLSAFCLPGAGSTPSCLACRDKQNSDADRDKQDEKAWNLRLADKRDQALDRSSGAPLQVRLTDAVHGRARLVCAEA